MPIRKPNESPPFRIVRVSHVELGVRDLAAARAFYVDCLGLLVTEATADSLYLRGLEERNHHSIVLRKAREPKRGCRLCARWRAWAQSRPNLSHARCAMFTRRFANRPFG